MDNKKSKIKIDLVYLWVNGNDPNWLEEKSAWEKKLNIKKNNDTDSSRYVDNEELRFSLRSMEQNAPWINKIFIVTNGQIPSWLDISNPKIQIINHSEIMPADALPTFNSCAIEACIANIPNLSEHFLLANDDCFFHRPVKPDFFFTKDGKPIVRLIRRKADFSKLKSSLYSRTIYYSQRLIKKKFKKDFNFIPHHCIDAYSKKAYLECVKEFQEEFDKATYSRFRNLSVQRIIVSLYMLLKKQCKLDEIKPNMYWIHMNSLSINLDKIDLLRHIIRKHTPQLLCLNDESWVQPMIRNSFKSFLTELYPNSCSFEIKKEFLIKPISSKNVVVYSVSNEYADIFSVSLQSLLENSATDNSFDIVILNHGIITSKKMLLEKMAKNYPNINIRFINVSDFITEFFKNIKIKSKSLYQEDCLDKLIIPIILSKYERVLYLDSDTCINTNISKIFEFDFQNQPLIAIRDTVSPNLKNLPDTQQYFVCDLKLAFPKKYFNSGVLLFNIENLDIKKYQEELENAINTTCFNFPSQDILNIIFNKKVTLIHPKWNYINSIFAHSRNYLNFVTPEEKEEYIEAMNDIKIIHYTSIVKPWLVRFIDNCEIFWKYAKNSLFYESILCSYKNKKDLYKYTGLKSGFIFKYYLVTVLSLITFEKCHKIMVRRMLYKKIFVKLKYVEANL